MTEICELTKENGIAIKERCQCRSVVGDVLSNMRKSIETKYLKNKKDIDTWMRNFWLPGKVLNKLIDLYNPDYTVFDKSLEENPSRTKYALYYYEGKVRCFIRLSKQPIRVFDINALAAYCLEFNETRLKLLLVTEKGIFTRQYTLEDNDDYGYYYRPIHDEETVCQFDTEMSGMGIMGRCSKATIFKVNDGLAICFLINGHLIASFLNIDKLDDVIKKKIKMPEQRFYPVEDFCVIPAMNGNMRGLLVKFDRSFTLKKEITEVGLVLDMGVY